MTTTNKAASTAKTTSTATAPEVKAPKVTLNSILLAVVPALRTLKEGETHTESELADHAANLETFIGAQGNALAVYLVNKTDEVDTVLSIMQNAIAAIPAVLESEAENIKQRKAEREGKRAQAAAEKAKAAEAQAKIDAQAKADMLKTLQEAGFDLAIAEQMVLTAQKAKRVANAAPVVSYDRVTVEYKGTQYEMPVKGNMSQALKDIFADSGESDREAFIAKYKVAATESTEAAE